MLKVFYVLQINKIKTRNERELAGHSTQITDRHPFFVPALLKKHHGSIRSFLHSPECSVKK